MEIKWIGDGREIMWPQMRARIVSCLLGIRVKDASGHSPGGGGAARIVVHIDSNNIGREKAEVLLSEDMELERG